MVTNRGERMEMTYKELSKILYSQFVTNRRTASTLMICVVMRLITLISLVSLVSCLPAVFDIIPPKTVQAQRVTIRPTLINRSKSHSRQSYKPCVQLRHNHYAKCQEKIKRKRLRKCFRAWLEKNGRIGRHRNDLLPCLYFRER